MSKWGKALGIARVAANIVGFIVPGVAEVEKRAEDVAHLKGAQKQDAVLQLVKTSLAASEDLTGQDLLNNDAVEAATRAVIDAVVHLHNVSAKAALAPASAAQLGVVTGSTGE